MNIEFHDRLRIALRRENLNMRQFADFTDINYSCIREYMSGIHEPNFCNLKKIIQQLPKTNTHWLICGTIQALEELV